MGFWNDITGAIAGSPGGLWGSAAGAVAGNNKREKSKDEERRHGTVNTRHPQGTANYYNDSYGPLLEWMQQQPGGAVSDGFANILQNFQGDQDHLQGFLQNSAPFLASGALEGSQSFQALQNFAQNTSQFSDPTQAYGAGAGQIAQSAKAAQTAGGNQLARSGLGRSAAQASLASQAMQTAGGQQANLFSNLHQQGMRDRFGMQQSALTNAFDAQRQIATIALGHNPMPRQSGGGGGSPWAGVAGGLGSLIGGVLGGPGGAAAGSVAGNVVSDV